MAPKRRKVLLRAREVSARILAIVSSKVAANNIYGEFGIKDTEARITLLPQEQIRTSACV